MITAVVVSLSLGAVLMIIGIGLLLAPDQLAKLSQFLNRKVFDDNAVLSHRVLAGIICIAVGGLLLWSYFGYALVK